MSNHDSHIILFEGFELLLDRTNEVMKASNHLDRDEVLEELRQFRPFLDKLIDATRSAFAAEDYGEPERASWVSRLLGWLSGW